MDISFNQILNIMKKANVEEYIQLSYNDGTVCIIAAQSKGDNIITCNGKDNMYSIQIIKNQILEEYCFDLLEAVFEGGGVKYENLESIEVCNR